MAFSVSNITGWVNENKQTILTAAILEPKALQSFYQMPGVKYKEAIKYMSVESPLVAYAGCATLTTSGTTTLIDKDIEVVKLMQYECLDPETLETTSFQLGMKPGFNESFSFEQEYTKAKIATIQKQLDGWAFSTFTGTTARPSGLLYYALNDADVNDRSFTWSATTWSADDYINEVYGMYNALPDEIKYAEDLKLYVPFTISTKMVQAFIIDDKYHIDLTDPTVKGGLVSWNFPGLPVQVFPCQMAANNVVLGPASNFIVAYDLKSDFDTVELDYNKKTRGLDWFIAFRIGFNYFFGDYIVWSR
jgi:hypothetical protein